MDFLILSIRDLSNFIREGPRLYNNLKRIAKISQKNKNIEIFGLSNQAKTQTKEGE